MLCDGLQKNKDMAKELELSKWEATRRLSLFLKLRKGKTITEKTVKDFDKLLDKMYMNFKDHEDGTISEWREKDFRNKVRISLREARESNYWLRIVYALEDIESDDLKRLLQESVELKNILGAILKNSGDNDNKD